MQKRINTKKEFYKLYNAGLLGNRALAWDTYQELLASDWRDRVCIRGVGIPRNRVRYNIPFEKIHDEIADLESKGFPKSILRFNQSMPDQNLVIQGEVAYLLHGWEMTYTTIKIPMNAAFQKETKIARGLAVKVILESAMDPSSFADLEALFDLYPESAVEFSTYDIAVGNIPGRNTVFWEVRHY